MSGKNKNKKGKVVNDPKVVEMTNCMSDKNDPTGSYTGIPTDKDEVPVQDADDL